MTLKKDKASNTLVAIKLILKHARQKVGYWFTLACHPTLEYADAVWEPTLAKPIESLEMPQHGRGGVL